MGTLVEEDGAAFGWAMGLSPPSRRSAHEPDAGSPDQVFESAAGQFVQCNDLIPLGKESRAET
jgi:hypothetical protein